jgi:hypothetical protein
MLAGILELLSWLKQWHNEPSEEYDGQQLGEFLRAIWDGEWGVWVEPGRP